MVRNSGICWGFFVFGVVLVEASNARCGLLVANHGPFAWGPDPAAAAHNAVILEAVARMAYFTATLSPEAEPVGGGLHDKHYLRKHGSSAYYGQAKETK